MPRVLLRINEARKFRLLLVFQALHLKSLLVEVEASLLLFVVVLFLHPLTPGWRFQVLLLLSSPVLLLTATALPAVLTDSLVEKIFGDSPRNPSFLGFLRRPSDLFVCSNAVCDRTFPPSTAVQLLLPHLRPLLGRVHLFQHNIHGLPLIWDINVNCVTVGRYFLRLARLMSHLQPLPHLLQCLPQLLVV